MALPGPWHMCGGQEDKLQDSVSPSTMDPGQWTEVPPQCWWQAPQSTKPACISGWPRALRCNWPSWRSDPTPTCQMLELQYAATCLVYTLPTEPPPQVFTSFSAMINSVTRIIVILIDFYKVTATWDNTLWSSPLPLSYCSSLIHSTAHILVHLCLCIPIPSAQGHFSLQYSMVHPKHLENLHSNTSKLGVS